MAVVPQRRSVLFLPVVRGIYDYGLTSALVPLIEAAAADAGMQGIFPSESVGHGGLICTDAHFVAYWEEWREQLHDIAALVVFSGDFMQERRVMDAVRLLPPDVPVFLIVNNDDPADMEGSAVGDSLCGSLSVHHNVRMLGRSIMRSWRLDMRSSQLGGALTACAALVRGCESLRHMRLAMLGVNPDAFATTFVNQPLLFKLGFSLHTVELMDLWGDVVLGGELAEGQNRFAAAFGEVRLAAPIARDDVRVAAMRERVGALVPVDADDPNLDRLVRCLVWLDQTFKAGLIDAGAIHCWPEFDRFFGMRPCGFSMLANALLGKPVVCEVDVCHAIMAGLGQALTGEPAVILDVNNNGWDPRVFNVFHCSQTPPNWLVGGGTLESGGTVCGTVTPGPFTAVSAATSADAFNATVFAGRFVPGDGGSRGCTGWAFVPNFPDVLRQIENTGIHHFVAMKGEIGAEVCDILRFRGLTVTDLTVPVPDAAETAALLPSCPGGGIA